MQIGSREIKWISGANKGFFPASITQINANQAINATKATQPVAKQRFIEFLDGNDTAAEPSRIRYIGNITNSRSHPYVYPTRLAATRACVAMGATGLCSKEQGTNFSNGTAGWYSDFRGWWMNGTECYPTPHARTNVRIHLTQRAQIF